MSKEAQFYKHTPFKATANPNPKRMVTLDLQITEVDHERKHAHVVTRGGVKLVLTFNRKTDCFNLHKFSLADPTKIGGSVYNNWEVHARDADQLNELHLMWA